MRTSIECRESLQNTKGYECLKNAKNFIQTLIAWVWQKMSIFSVKLDKKLKPTSFPIKLRFYLVFLIF